MSGKWAELLKQAAPQITRALVLRDPTSAAGIGQFASVRSVAQSLGVELTPLDVRDTGEIERGVQAFARAGNGGAIVTAGGTAAHRNLVIDLFARYKLPATYPYRYYAADGGLMSYGPNTHEPIRRAAAYVDRILKGEKPGDLPVQAPDKFELVVNLKTAKALGLNIPQSLLARADEIIESEARCPVLTLGGHPVLKRTLDLLKVALPSSAADQSCYVSATGLELEVPEEFRSATHVLENQ